MEAVCQEEKRTTEIDVEQLRRKAESGDAGAQTAWAACLRQGCGVERNKEEAVRWLREAARQHDPEALYQIGRCSEVGSGMPADENYALNCYAEAAKMGHEQAQYAYGMCLLGGIGCLRNEEKALLWLKEAADRGNKAAHQQVTRLQERLQKKMITTTPPEDESPIQPESRQEFVPVSPKPYKLEKKQVEAQEKAKVQQVTSVGVERPVTRSSTPLVVIFILCGMACGVLMQPVYRSLSFRASFDSEGMLTLFMAFVGALIGVGLSLPLRGLYSHAKDALPFYGLLLLLPLLVFVLAGIILAVLTTVANIVATIVRVLLWIIGIVVVLGILGYFFG